MSTFLRQCLRRGVRGALGGLAATGTMSVLLGASDWAGVMNRQPPKKIVATLLPRLDRQETDVLAVVSHVGYGAGAGALYGLAVPPGRRNLRTGLVYGVLLWAAGYEGWLPVMGILPPAHRDKPGRSVTMFLAHLVYGATLGTCSATRRASTRRASAHRFAAAGDDAG